MTSPNRAAIVGTGLIGGSLGLALRKMGWHVTGRDRDEVRARRALELGALDEVGDDPEAEITFVATPVGAVPDEARTALARGGIVTDVGSVKGAIVSEIGDPRFVGGHPMAGSEQEGVEGSDPELFEGATWVLTPTAATDPTAYARIRNVVTSLGADVVAVDPDHHDQLVALVSHVPHLTAATLMTRVAAGHPGIWPDICADNREAIVATLDSLLASLTQMRQTVAAGDRPALAAALERARAARVSLPTRAPRPEDVVEVRVPVPDRAGVLAEVTTLLGELDVNIWDLEIAHSAEGDRGVLLLVIDARLGDLARGALLARGYRPSVQRLE